MGLKMCKAVRQRPLHLSGECSTKAWYCMRSGLVEGLVLFHEVIWSNIAFCKLSSVLLITSCLKMIRKKTFLKLCLLIRAFHLCRPHRQLVRKSGCQTQSYLFFVAAEYDLNMALQAGPFLKFLPINLPIHVIFLKLNSAIWVHILTWVTWF